MDCRKKQQNHGDDQMKILGGMEMISGQAKAGVAQLVECISRQHQANTQSHDCVPTWNGNAKLFDDSEFDVFLYEHLCSSVDFFLVSLVKQEGNGDLDRFAVDGKLDTGIPKDENGRMALKKCIYEIKPARSESMTSWINRTSAPGATHSE